MYKMMRTNTTVLTMATTDNAYVFLYVYNLKYFILVMMGFYNS